jgi:hypothetical protein
MLSLLVLLIICIFILTWVALRSRECHKRLLETFKAEDEMMRHDISEEEMYIYFLIIDIYRENLNREPTEDELYAHFDQVRSRQKQMSQVYQEIVTGEEYRLLHSDQGTQGSVYSTKENIEDYDTVHAMVLELMPQNLGIYSETNRKNYINFLVAKYRELGHDKVALKKYIQKTPEYMEYMEKTTGVSSKEEIDRKDEEMMMFVLKRSAISLYNEASKSKKLRGELKQLYLESDRSKNVFLDKIRDHPLNKRNIEPGITVETDLFKYVINRPDTTKSSSMRIGTSSKSTEEVVGEDSSCEFFKKAQYLNSVQNRRNLDQQKYMCEMSKLYDNVNKDMTLAEGHEWSVPQKRAPVCYAEPGCDLHASRDQTSLIGTVLDSVNDRILPSFEYKENV